MKEERHMNPLFSWTIIHLLSNHSHSINSFLSLHHFSILHSSILYHHFLHLVFAFRNSFVFVFQINKGNNSNPLLHSLQFIFLSHFIALIVTIIDDVSLHFDKWREFALLPFVFKKKKKRAFVLLTFLPKNKKEKKEE